MAEPVLANVSFTGLPSNSLAPAREYTTQALQKWSSIKRSLPRVEAVKALHVYDFDNTLFASPLPNRALWQGGTIGLLQNQQTLLGGGWWHDPNILRATGEGFEEESRRGWEGWWNEQIVQLVKLSELQGDALTVLLTGRNQERFEELVEHMVRAKGLEFDMICLRPDMGPQGETFESTMKYKQRFLADLVNTYSAAEEIKIYEDRPKHVAAFREFLTNLNTAASQQVPTASRREPIGFAVIQVAERETTLHKLTEAAEVQRMINAHNAAIHKGAAPAYAKHWVIDRFVAYTGYLLAPEVTDQLFRLANLPASDSQQPTDPDLRLSGHSIVISRRPLPPAVSAKIGPIGTTQRWRAVAIGASHTQNGKVTALRVEPVPATSEIAVLDEPPHIVMSARGQVKPNDSMRVYKWSLLPPHRRVEFDSVIKENVLLTLSPEHPDVKPSWWKGKRLNLDSVADAAPNSTETAAKIPKVNIPTGPAADRDRNFPLLPPSDHSNASMSNNQSSSTRGRISSNPSIRSRGSGRSNQNVPHGQGQNQNQNNSQQQGGGRGGRGRGRSGPGAGYRSLDDAPGQSRGRRAADGSMPDEVVAEIWQWLDTQPEQFDDFHIKRLYRDLEVEVDVHVGWITGMARRRSE